MKYKFLNKSKSILLNHEMTLQNVSCFILLLILCVIYICKLYTAITFPYVQEYREATMIVFAEEFSRGHNPYALSALANDIPPITSVYGFAGALFCAPFVAIFSNLGVSSLIVCRVIVLIAEMLGLLFIAKTIKIITDNNLSALCACILVSACYWRYHPFGGAYPDQFGILINILLMYLVIKDEYSKDNKYRPTIYALLLVLAFYVKQYFVFGVIGLLVYMFLHSKKDLIKLIISGAVLTIVSLIIVQLCFPLFLSEALPISQGSTSSYGFAYSLGQIPFIIRQYFLIPVAVLAAIIIMHIILPIIKHDRPRCALPIHSYVVLQIICSFPLIMIIARNNGTYMTYWLQMWFIYVSIGIAIALNNMTTHVIRTAIIFAVAILFTFQARQLLFEPLHSQNEYEMWENTYNLLDQYAADGNILADAHLSLYLYENGIPTSEYGQCEYSGIDSYNNVINHPLWSHFPFAIKILDKNIAHENDVKKKVANREYSLLALGNIYRYYITDEELIASGYRKIDELEIPIGNITVDTSFWVPEK